MPRQFAIPFNGSNPEAFLKRLEPYKENVHHIYLGIPSLLDNSMKVSWFKKKESSNNFALSDKIFNLTIEDISIEDYERNCFSFLELSYGKYKRFLVLNNMVWNISSNDLDEFVQKSIIPIVSHFGIEGIIVGEYEIAKTLRRYLPKIELHLSLQSFIKEVSILINWHKELNLSSINVPFFMSRQIDEIRYIKKRLELPIKLLVTESCICGCPMMISHRAYQSGLFKNYKIFCDDSPLSFAFKGSYVLPRHLKLFDDCVDIFKISTRRTETNRLFRIIDYYINEKDGDLNLWDVVTGRLQKRLMSIHLEHPEFKIPINKLPDKIIRCNCEECLTCNKCELLMKKFFKEGNIDNLSHLI